jgi:hypothetical protein
MWFLGSPFKKFGGGVSNKCSYSKMFYQIPAHREFFIQESHIWLVVSTYPSEK